MYLAGFLLLMTFVDVRGQEDDGECLGSIVVFREGDRAPSVSFSTDPWKSKWEQIGYGHMTQGGEQKMYQFGRWIRRRYVRQIRKIKVTKRQTWKEVISARAAQDDAAMRSARLVVAGVVDDAEKAPSGRAAFDTLPISVGAELKDPLFAHGGCPAYNQRFREVLKRQMYQEFWNRHVSLVEHVSQITNQKCDSLLDIDRIVEPLIIEEDQGLSLPAWCNSTILDTLKSIYLKKLEIEAANRELNAFKCHKFADSLVRTFQTAKASKQFMLKLFAGGSDAISNVIGAFDVTNWPARIPAFGSSVIFEMRRKSSRTYVTMYYKSTNGLVQLKLRNCGYVCDYSKFMVMMQPLLNVQPSCS